MKRIGLLSDTHAYWDNRYAEHFAACDEIWHAGDIGSLEVAEKLQQVAPLRAVYGNIDGSDIRRMFPEKYRFKCEDVEVLLKHIGGYPGHYDSSIRRSLYAHPPKLFISGHSHILKVQYDHMLQCLHLNPGAAGLYGCQQVRTLMRFVIDGSEIKDLDIIELSMELPFG